MIAARSYYEDKAKKGSGKVKANSLLSAKQPIFDYEIPALY